MTDFYGVEVMECEGDCLKFRVQLVYPDAGPPGGHEFARAVLECLTGHIRDNPFEAALEASPGVPPTHFIRAVHVVCSERDEASANALAQFTRDGKPHQGDTDWIMALRVHDPAWLEGLCPGQHDALGASNSEDRTLYGWTDCTSTVNQTGLHQSLEALERFYGECLPAWKREMLEGWYGGRFVPLVAHPGALYGDYPVPRLLDWIGLEEFPWSESEGLYPCTKTPRQRHCAFLCHFLPHQRPDDGFVVATPSPHVHDPPTYRVGTIYENMAHFADAMFAAAVEQSKDDVLVGPWIARERAQARAWFEQRGMKVSSRSADEIFADFMADLLSPDVPPDLVESVLREFFGNSRLLDDVTPLEHTWFMRVFEHHLPLVRAYLWKGDDEGRIFPYELRFCAGMLMHMALTAQDVAQMWDVLSEPQREHDDHMLLVLALLRVEGVEVIPRILELLRSHDDPQALLYLGAEYEIPMFKANLVRLGLEVPAYLDVFLEAFVEAVDAIER